MVLASSDHRWYCHHFTKFEFKFSPDHSPATTERCLIIHKPLRPSSPHPSSTTGCGYTFLKTAEMISIDHFEADFSLLLKKMDDTCLPELAKAAQVTSVAWTWFAWEKRRSGFDQFYATTTWKLTSIRGSSQAWPKKWHINWNVQEWLASRHFDSIIIDTGWVIEKWFKEHFKTIFYFKKVFSPLSPVE